jgi:hypothetical protein
MEVLPQTRGFDLNQSRASVGIERLGVVTRAIASGLGRPFDPLDEVATPAIV